MAWYDDNPLSSESEDGIRKAVGSSYLNGSFSGADIKVIVHLPVNPIAIKTEIDNLESQLSEITRQREAAIRVDTDSVETLVRLENRERSILDRYVALQELGKNEGSTTTKTLATLQTISWSIFREKTPVRFLGAVYPRAFVRGPRTVAGSMIFTMFNKHALQDILNWGLSPYSTGHVEADHDYYRDTTVLIDQLPPLDMTLLFANEYGSISYMNLWGVEFMSEGGTFSIEDLFSESVIQYVARDIDPIREQLQRQTDAYTNSLTGKVKPKTASQLRMEEITNTGESPTYKRRNPYI